MLRLPFPLFYYNKSTAYAFLVLTQFTAHYLALEMNEKLPAENAGKKFMNKK